MTISSRFAVAVHVLTLLAASPGVPVTSERLAASASTNPVVIRRILCMLAKAGLTTSRLGTGGGALLGRPASEITLAEVYMAVEEGRLFAMHHEAPDPRCLVGRNIQEVLTETMGNAERAMKRALAERTIAEVVERVSVVGSAERGGLSL